MQHLLTDFVDLLLFVLSSQVLEYRIHLPQRRGDRGGARLIVRSPVTQRIETIAAEQRSVCLEVWCFWKSSMVQKRP